MNSFSISLSAHISSQPGQNKDGIADWYCQRVEYTHEETLQDDINHWDLLCVIEMICFLLFAHLVVQAFCQMMCDGENARQVVNP